MSEPNGKKKHRSPNYPAMNLKRAVERVAALNEKYKRFHVPIAQAFELWVLKPNSSSGQQCIGALKAYGLIDVEGEGDARKIRVSDVAHKIVANHADRAKLLQQVALRPAIHSELWTKFKTPEGLPPDEILRQYLVFDREEGVFNEDSVGSFISSFRETLAFAQLNDADMMVEEENPSGDNPMHDVPNPTTPPEKPAFVKPLAPGAREDVYTLEEGQVILRMPGKLSAASYQDFEDWVNLVLRKAKRSVEGSSE